MPTTLVATPADPTTSPTVSTPADGDTANAASVDGAFQFFLNTLAWMRANAAILGSPNTFTGTETFSAGVTMQALLTMTAAAAASLSRSGDQTILKSGSGKLQFGTSIATDLEMWVGGAVKAVLRASDGKLQGQSTAIGDSGTTLVSKDYADFASNDSGFTVGANWAQYGSARLRKSPAGLVHFAFQFQALAGAGTAMAVFPAGFIPGAVTACALSTTGAANSAFLDASGHLNLKTAPATGDYVAVSGTFTAG